MVCVMGGRSVGATLVAIGNSHHLADGIYYKGKIASVLRSAPSLPIDTPSCRQDLTGSTSKSSEPYADNL